jgi:hypothetical protein
LAIHTNFAMQHAIRDGHRQPRDVLFGLLQHAGSQRGDLVDGRGQPQQLGFGAQARRFLAGLLPFLEAAVVAFAFG